MTLEELTQFGELKKWLKILSNRIKSVSILVEEIQTQVDEAYYTAMIDFDKEGKMKLGRKRKE